MTKANKKELRCPKWDEKEEVDSLVQETKKQKQEEEYLKYLQDQEKYLFPRFQHEKPKGEFLGYSVWYDDYPEHYNRDTEGTYTKDAYHLLLEYKADLIESHLISGTTLWMTYLVDNGIKRNLVDLECDNVREYMKYVGIVSDESDDESG